MSGAGQQRRLDGKIAIVSGGARGIGEAIARRLAAEGARVMIGDVLDDLGRAVAASVGAAVGYRHLNVTQAVDWQAIVEATDRSFGPPSILVSNAGIMSSKPFEDATPEEFRQAFEVNAVGSLYGIHAVLGPMRSNGGGSIITLSSVAGLMGIEGLSAYCASKAANTMIARCAAIELGRYNIRVNSVHPGRVETPMSRSDAVAAVSPPSSYSPPPLGRVGEVSDVAGFVVFLASDDAAYVTGAQHVVDGGRQAGPLYSVLESAASGQIT
jgi:3alpha(or 20beta)-hydroxysteroid dehydrogenase